MSGSKAIHILGYASGLGAEETGTVDGPVIMRQSPYLKRLQKQGIQLIWDDFIHAELSPQHSNSKAEIIAENCKILAENIDKTARAKNFFCVLGGDHSAAIGTWSGLSHALKEQGSLGLIWVDAHMDSHTQHTTCSGNVHGMPVASLLGYGLPILTQILNQEPKILPANLCLIGVRSFEQGEAALLKELNVRIFYMEEVKERGLSIIMEEALEIVTANTTAFGISIDIDGITPEEAPGTGCPVPCGIETKDLYSALQLVAKNSKLAGFEIVEFDPHKDKNKKTEKIIAHLIATFGCKV